MLKHCRIKLILIHGQTKPYQSILSNYALFYYTAEFYLTLIHCGTTPYFNTLPKYNPIFDKTELYPILLQC